MWWSPNDARIAVERFGEAPVGIVTRAAIGADGTKVYNQRYPAAGTPNVLVELYGMNADGTGQVKVDLGSNPTSISPGWTGRPMARPCSCSARAVIKKTLDVLKVDPATGESAILFTAKSGERSWINLSGAYWPMKDGSLIWRSERDGYGHLYRFAKGKWTQLSKGEWTVQSLNGVDGAKGRIFFTGNKDGALGSMSIRSSIARPNVVTRLTEHGWWNSA